MDEFKILNDYNEKLNGVQNKMRPKREIVIEDLQKEMDRQLDKIDMINDCICLFGKKNEIRSDLTVMKNKISELREVLADVRHSINIFKTVQMPQTTLLIKNMRDQQLKMLKFIEKIDSEGKSFSSTDIDSKPKHTNYIDEKYTHNHRSVLSSNLTTPNNLPVFSKFNTITPKLHQSPFKIRGDPRMLVNLNKQFEGRIKPDEFDKVPKYLRGRDTLDELSSFLQDIIVKCFMQKYTLLHRDRENVQPNQTQRWRMYRSQMEYFPGEMFVTEGDIATLIGRMMDKKMSNRITMLRHLHIIQEMRKGSATCYIWKGIK